MRLRTKLLVASLIPASAIALAVTTPNEEPNKIPTTRQKVVGWLKQKGKEELKSQAIDKLVEKADDAVMAAGERWIGGPFKKDGGDYDNVRYVVNEIVDVREWAKSPAEKAWVAVHVVVGNNTHTATVKQDVPGAFVGSDGKWHLPDNGQEQLKPKDPPPNQTLASRPNSTVSSAPPANWLDDDDFGGPPPREPSANSPSHSASGVTRQNTMGHAETTDHFPQQRTEAESSANSHQQIELKAGQQTVIPIQTKDWTLGSDGHWIGTPAQNVAPFTPAPAQVAPQPSPAAEPHEGGGGRSGFGTGGATGHGNWTGPDHGGNDGVA